jgi:hypothetical protein
MRKIFFLLALLLPFFASRVDAEDKNVVKEIPLIKIGEGVGGRSLHSECIYSCYYGMFEGILTTVSGNLGQIEVVVSNETTGEIWHFLFDSTSYQQDLLHISGTPGFYCVTYTTDRGEKYQGTFTLN